MKGIGGEERCVQGPGSFLRVIVIAKYRAVEVARCRGYKRFHGRVTSRKEASKTRSKTLV